MPGPDPLPVPVGSLLAHLLNFAETADRNWSFGGHTVTVPFDPNQGYWEYTDTTYEPWLFDRAECWRMLHTMTNVARWQTKAQSDLAYYESRLSATGYFLNKTGEDDSKYSYVHPWSSNRAKQDAAYQATVASWANTYTSGMFWTERELWVAMNAAVQYHSVSGNAAALTRAQAMADQWDAVCAGRPAPLVTYTQHEGGGPGGTQPTDLVSSPWMSALYFQAARQYIAKVPSAAAQVHRQVSDYFDWLDTPGTRGFYPGTDAHPQYTNYLFPAYLAGGTLVGDAGPDAGNMVHALDVAGLVAFAVQAKTALGLPTAAAQRRLAQMKDTAQLAFTDLTRTTITLPKHRVRPPRMFNWWTRGLLELHALGMA